MAITYQVRALGPDGSLLVATESVKHTDAWYRIYEYVNDRRDAILRALEYDPSPQLREALQEELRAIHNVTYQERTVTTGEWRWA